MSTKRAEDRSKPPIGYEVVLICHDAEGNEISEEEARRDELAEAHYVPRLVMLSASSERGAVEHCWRMHDAMHERVRRETLRELVAAECHCCSVGMERTPEGDGYVHRDEDGFIWTCYASRKAVGMLREVSP